MADATQTPPTGTVDITTTVNSLVSSFETWANNFLFGELILIPWMTWAALPVLSTLVKAAIGWGVNLLVGSAVLEAFFLNTAIRKASQAQDYIDAVTLKNSLPATATQEEYQNAENAEMVAFRNFVLLSN